MSAVLTGLGVILAISASRSFAPGSVCLASTTMTLVLPTMIVTLPPAPPNAAHTSGLTCFIVIGGGAGACGGCCAAAVVTRVGTPITARTRETVHKDFTKVLLFTDRHSTTQPLRVTPVPLVELSLPDPPAQRFC